MNVRLKVLGGGQSVTGSKYLLEIDDFKLLLDCGLFQGVSDIRRRNWNELPVDPTTIDAVILTHAHLDHSGYLPRLFKQGYNGPVYCTTATTELLALLLYDSAKLQEEEAAWAKKKGYSRHENPEPLYKSEDVDNVMPRVQGYEFREEIAITDKIAIKFYYAGHILGAACVQVILKGDKQSKKIVFSGDLGRESDPILYAPEIVPEADIVFVESTYGSRELKRISPTEEIAEIINETFARKGCVLIPAFAIGRTQNLLLMFKQLFERKLIPETPIYMDSPMAIRATALYRKYHKYHKLDDYEMDNDEHFLNLQRNLNIVQTHDGSMGLNSIPSNAIFISSSGMMTGGRIMHHLYHRLPNKNDTLMVVGFQARATRGRLILDGEPFIRLFGHLVPVRCKVRQIDRLTAHADQAGLMKWIRGIETKPKRVFVVHGEVESSNVLADLIRKEKGWNVTVPDYLDSYELFKSI